MNASYGVQVSMDGSPPIASSSNNYKMKKEFQHSQERKKRLTNEQLDSLEMSFQEEIKLEPERKMKLAQELDLQPRQVAVWFQNRRARWKVKQIERLYDALKKEFLVITRENQKLQAEVSFLSFFCHAYTAYCFILSCLLRHCQVMQLKAKLEDQARSGKKGSTAYTEAGSAKDSVESKSVAFQSGRKLQAVSYHQIAADCNYMFNNVM